MLACLRFSCFSPLLSPFRLTQSHYKPTSTTVRQCEIMLRLLLRQHILIPIKSLQQPNRHVTRLRQRKLLPDTDPWAPIEREVAPIDLPSHAPLGLEPICVLTPEVLASLHHVYRILHFLALLHEDRGLFTGSAAERKGGVLRSEADVERNDYCD